VEFSFSDLLLTLLSPPDEGYGNSPTGGLGEVPKEHVARLMLEDGLCFEGTAFRATGETVGEVVFNTSMTGYQKILTDPSYRGQMVTMTYPLLGIMELPRRETFADCLSPLQRANRSWSGSCQD
jgi:hypothetical protein